MNKEEIPGVLNPLGWKLSGNIATKNVVGQLEIIRNPQKVPTRISLITGNDEEIEAALNLVKKFGWKELYCHGQVNFLLYSALKAIKDHKKYGLKRVCTIFAEQNCFSNKEDRIHSRNSDGPEGR